MNIITFNNVHFSYPPVEGDVDENGNQIQSPVVFDHFSAELPSGFVSLVGPNGSGKSTFMLLASGRILPQEGKIWLFGKDTCTLTDDDKNELASFIYQNMEFDTDDKVFDLLDYVYSNGALKGNAKGIQNPGKDFLEEIKASIKKRKTGRPVRLEVENDCDAESLAFLPFCAMRDTTLTPGKTACFGSLKQRRKMGRTI